VGGPHGVVPFLTRTVAAAIGAAALACVPAHAAPPAIDYMLNCQGCHLADGSGSAGSVPDLRDNLGRLAAVAGGRAYLVQVPGSRNAPIDDAALAAVLNWMMDAFSASTRPADWTPYSPDEVARVRAERVVDIPARRAALFEAIGHSGR